MLRTTGAQRGPLIERVALAGLERADRAANRLYGDRFNPLYQSGTIVVFLYVVLAVTGLWLVLFYRVGSPWESVAAITADRWVGNWVRGVHRYASDLAVVFTLLHAWRMFAQGRSRGARAHAWLSGWVLMLLVYACAWTGFVMVWDTFGEQLALAGARMIDALPVLSEPTGRAFTGEQPLPSAFFFLNLFAHIGIPLALAVVFLFHVKRLQRPALLPPVPVRWVLGAGLLGVALLRPIAMVARANPLALPRHVPMDLFFAFWVPVARVMSGGTALMLAIGLVAVAAGLPWLRRHRREGRPAPSWVDEDVCVGCVQCSIDCPFGAITMVERTSRRSELVARVDPDLCVSCGVCAGSCGPMGVGPPGRTGRDQMAATREFVSGLGADVPQAVVIACAYGAGRHAGSTIAGATIVPIDCCGNLHTSVVETILRVGVGGVLVAACPARDCRNREGPRWLVERMYQSREARLQPRVDRRRVAVVHVEARDRARLEAAVAGFIAELPRVDAAAATSPTVEEGLCESALAQR